MARSLGRYATRGNGNPPLVKDYVILKSYTTPKGKVYYKGSFSYGGYSYSISTDGVSMPSTRNEDKDIMFANIAVFRDTMKNGR